MAGGLPCAPRLDNSAAVAVPIPLRAQRDTVIRKLEQKLPLWFCERSGCEQRPGPVNACSLSECT